MPVCTLCPRRYHLETPCLWCGGCASYWEQIPLWDLANDSPSLTASILFFKLASSRHKTVPTSLLPSPRLRQEVLTTKMNCHHRLSAQFNFPQPKLFPQTPSHRTSHTPLRNYRLGEAQGGSGANSMTSGHRGG